jgi:hypothetical protein
VRDANGGVCRVHALTTRAGRPEHIDPQILVLDLEIDLLRLGQNRDSRGRRVNAALTLGDGNSLHAMNSGFPAHGPERALSLDLENRFLHTAKGSVGLGDDLDAPAPAFGKPCVHAVKVGGKNRGLVSAGTAPDLDDRGAVVERIVRNQRRLDLGEKLLDGRFQARLLSLRLGGHVGVVRTQKLAGFRELLLVSRELVAHLDESAQLSMLSAQCSHALLVAHRLRIGELSLYLSGAREGIREPVA